MASAESATYAIIEIGSLPRHAQVRSGGQFVVIDEGEHRLPGNAEHGNDESAVDIGAVVGVGVVDDVTTRGTIATVTELPDEMRAMVQRWELRQDGSVLHGSVADVLPVRTSDGVLAVLKISALRPQGEHEHLVLRQWGGAGAVRLLRADPHHRALLLERAHPQSLQTRSDIDACEVVAGLYKRLHVPAMPQLRSSTAQLVFWMQDFEALPRNAPIPHRLVEQAIALSRDLTADVAGTDVVIHGNLHYGNVLAADREPWLAIAPTPHNGDPHYELAPMLWHRWDELSSGIRDGVRARFYTLVDAAGLDEDRARAWAVVRVVREATRELSRGPDADAGRLTKYVALAKAVQD